MNSGTPNSRFSPIAAPRNSATSVAIAITSAWSQRPTVPQRGNRSRHTSGNDRPVATPSLADRYWTSIAIRLAASTTHISAYPNLAPAWMLVAKLPGST